MTPSRQSVRLAALGLVVLAACRVERAPSGRPSGAVVAADSLASAAVLSALRQYYARTTARQWSLVQGCFWPRASITTVMRAARGGVEKVRTVTIEEAVEQAVTMKACPASFSDEIARANVETYGPLAEAWVTYRWKCGVAPDTVMTHYGIDAFHLMKHDGEWRIASLTYTQELPTQPLEH
jgi:hypothetical protein